MLLAIFAKPKVMIPMAFFTKVDLSEKGTEGPWSRRRIRQTPSLAVCHLLLVFAESMCSNNDKACCGYND